jgi:hypothetical protein
MKEIGLFLFLSTNEAVAVSKIQQDVSVTSLSLSTCGPRGISAVIQYIRNVPFIPRKSDPAENQESGTRPQRQEAESVAGFRDET